MTTRLSFSFVFSNMFSPPALFTACLRLSYTHTYPTTVPIIIHITICIYKCTPYPICFFHLNSKWMQKCLGSQGIVDITSKLQNYKCHAICVYSICNGSQTRSFKGVTKGTISGPRGPDSFGWDNIFAPENSERTFSEMSFEEKNMVSPRYKAFAQLKNYLLQELTK
ncbi:Ham1-like protein, putative [Plasmodium malariae]|uniref:Ham1-like protein, putative n=1 Tax=Plasmodium malariae TaxID=5858 RepID=A0A1C3KA82_PLAMA|nr:Ham1-like protein, putative [Plasmodium malariae]